MQLNVNVAYEWTFAEENTVYCSSLYEKKAQCITTHSNMRTPTSRRLISGINPRENLGQRVRAEYKRIV